MCSDTHGHHWAHYRFDALTNISHSGPPRTCLGETLKCSECLQCLHLTDGQHVVTQGTCEALIDLFSHLLAEVEFAMWQLRPRSSHYLPAVKPCKHSSEVVNLFILLYLSQLHSPPGFAHALGLKMHPWYNLV